MCFFGSINTLQQGINSSTLEIVDYKPLRNKGLFGKTIKLMVVWTSRVFFSSEGFPSLEVGQDHCLLFGDLDFQRNPDLVHRNMQNFVDFVLMPKNPCIGKLALYLF